jgi:hypothetical protein
MIGGSPKEVEAPHLFFSFHSCNSGLPSAFIGPKRINKIPAESDFLPLFKDNETFRMKNHIYLGQKRAQRRH